MTGKWTTYLLLASVYSSEIWMAFWGHDHHRVASITFTIFLLLLRKTKGNTTLENSLQSGGFFVPVRGSGETGFPEDVRLVSTSWGCKASESSYALCAFLEALYWVTQDTDLWKILDWCVLWLLVLHVCKLLTFFCLTHFLYKKQ